ncbi:MAG: hemopexin repeat-containing protein [Caldilineaceae bacterium]
MWDFLDRVKAINSANSQLCQLIDQIAALKNVGPRTTDLPSWEGNLDAAVTRPNGKTYFFKGDEYIRYDIATDRSDPGYLAKLKDGWPGLWESDIDAAMTWPNGKTYFFRGDEYIRYDIATDQADPGYPAKIHDGWPGLWEKRYRCCNDMVQWQNLLLQRRRIHSL